MPSSDPIRAPTFRAMAAHSSIVTPATGTKGTTSVAPIRGCSPLWWRMSMSCAALATATKAASATASGAPTMVTTVRLVLAPGSTSRSRAPATFSIVSVISLMTAWLRPSEKLGTHSTILSM